MIHSSASIRLPLQIVLALSAWNALNLCCWGNADELQVVRSVEYATYEGRDAKGNLTGKTKKLLADIYLPNLPKGDSEEVVGSFPTVLMVHGGAWFSGNKAHVTLHARDVAEAGYAVVAVNYRLAPHYKFPAQMEDLRSALRFIRSNAEKYKFDTDRIAAYGYSAGAQLAALLAVTQNEDPKNVVKGARVRAVVAGGTPCEFSWIPERSERLAFWLGSSRAEQPAAYANASPTTFVNEGDPPLFLFHGTKDRIVPYGSPKQMKTLLEKNHVPHAFFTVKDADHMRAFLDPKPRVAAVRFLEKHLELPAQSTE